MTKKFLYRITLSGCDDDTRFKHWLTSQEYALLERIAKKSVKFSTNVCKPVMVIELVPGQIPEN